VEKIINYYLELSAKECTQNVSAMETTLLSDKYHLDSEEPSVDIIQQGYGAMRGVMKPFCLVAASVVGALALYYLTGRKRH